ncbi:MAG: hypothetical protein AB1942_12560 [Pseudomonadota bacterium]
MEAGRQRVTKGWLSEAARLFEEPHQCALGFPETGGRLHPRDESIPSDDHLIRQRLIWRALNFTCEHMAPLPLEAIEGLLLSLRNWVLHGGEFRPVRPRFIG